MTDDSTILHVIGSLESDCLLCVRVSMQSIDS